MVFTPLHSLVGGALIGGAASANAALNGRVTGISGICGGVVLRAADWRWRALFLVGLASGGAAFALLDPAKVPALPADAPGRMALAGLLVGAGTQLGGGCTSGHGVCGLARFSPRSLVSVATFFATGIAAAKLTDAMHAVAPEQTQPAAPVWQHPALPSPREAGVMCAVGAATCVGAAVFVALARLPHRAQALSSELARAAERNRLGRIVSHASAYALGLLFSCGLALSGMTDPAKVAGFLDMGTPYWDPSLAFVMISGIGMAIPGFARLRQWKLAGKGPVLPSEINQVPDPSWKIDRALLTGAVLFGTGWGMSGICPGPAITHFGAHPTEATDWAFMGAMLVGLRFAGPAARLFKLTA